MESQADGLLCNGILGIRKRQALVVIKNNQEKWVRVDLSPVSELTDAIANFMTEIGAEGICQEALMPSDGEAEDAVSYESLTAYLPCENSKERITSLNTYLDSLMTLFPALAKPSFIIKDVNAADWGEEWKKYFHPLRIGKKFIVKPTWETYQPADDDIIIEIDPGMAFGTGQHQSTAMCIEAMEDIFSSAKASPRTVLDVGTGTGILGIAAARLGAERVVCLDVDEKAVAIAVENSILNGVTESLEVRHREISSLRHTYDLILANLTSKLLIELSTHLESLLAPGGYLVLSGIMEQQSREIETRFCIPPLRLIHSYQKGEWVCYVFGRSEP